MIGVIHKHGTSFKGLGKYLYHDLGADTDERVAWVETHNLASDDRDAAVRVMIATAMQQDELKRAAGIGAGGRKSKATVMHYSLAWHPEEDGELSRAEMLQAALASLNYLGTEEGEYLGKNKKTGEELRAVRTQHADEHQAVFVCHREPGKAPHVHVMLNRVHPEHGVMLPDTNDYRKLSAWALDYRQAQGKEEYCPQRAKNAAMRAQGYLTSCRRKSRQLYEAEQAKAAAKENSQKAEQLDAVRKRTAELSAKTARLKEQQKQSVRALEDGLLEGRRTERDAVAAATRAERTRLFGEYKPRIEELAARQGAERLAFEEAQETMRGRVSKSWEVFNTKSWMSEIRQSPLQAMKDAFSLAFSSGMQRQQLESYHAEEKRRLVSERQRAERDEARRLREQMRARTEGQALEYERARSTLLLGQRMESAKQRAEWRDLDRRRGAAIAVENRAPGLDQPARDAQSAGPPAVRPEFNEAAESQSQRQHGDDDARRLRQEFLDRMKGNSQDLGEGQGIE